MIMNKKFDNAHETLKSAINITSNLLHDKPEALFQPKKNLLNFYMFTDLKSAEILLYSYLADKNSPYYRYFVFQGIAIKCISEKYLEAYELANLCLKMDITPIYESYILNNIQIIKLKIIEKFDRIVSKI